MHMNAEPLLLVAYDLPYPEPLNSVRPLPDNLGVAMVLTPAPTAHSIAELRVEPLPARLAAPVDTCGDASLDALRTGMPAGAALPMLQGPGAWNGARASRRAARDGARVFAAPEAQGPARCLGGVT